MTDRYCTTKFLRQWILTVLFFCLLIVSSTTGMELVCGSPPHVHQLQSADQSRTLVQESRDQVLRGQPGNVAFEFARLQGEFRANMTALADEYLANGKPSLASATLAWIAPRDPSRRYLYLPADKYEDPQMPAAESANLQTDPQWSKQVQQLREQYAERLYELAKQCTDGEQTRMLGLILWEALWQNPDHQAVRRVLDYRTKDAAAQRIVVRIGRRAEPQLGWRNGAYREGNSAHFRLMTNADELAAKSLLEQLEVWRSLWRQVTLAYWISKDKSSVAAAVKNGRALPAEPESKHQVVLFLSRQDFLRTLARVPRIENSVGYFDSTAGRCYFYLDANDPNLVATQMHEMVHQLFQETGRRVRQPGEKGNFWLLEGAAMYFESLQPLDGNPNFSGQRVWSIGGFDAQRLQFARLRVQREGYSVPFENLVRRGRTDFQNDPDLSRLYSQCAGMFHFLMHYEPESNAASTPALDQTSNNPADAAFAMLLKSYAGRDRADMLESETGQTSAELEAAYKKWLSFSAETCGDHLALANGKRELALGFSQLTDSSLARLEATELSLLQLTGTSITDAALERLASKHRQLKFLYLDQTAVGDAGVVPLIRANQNLESLDLANTKITDATLMACRELNDLEDLWLTRTDVTDAVVPWLMALPKLKVLDVQGTQISPQGQERLRQRFR